MDYEKEAAIHYMDIIDKNRRELSKTMLDARLLVVELALVPHHLTQDSSSDGLHLGPTQKFELFGKIIQDAIDTHQNKEKEKQNAGLLLNPDLREAYKLMRRHKRKEQKKKTISHRNWNFHRSKGE